MTSAQLVALDAEPPAVASVVEKLKAVLEAAEAKEISSVAIAVVYRDGTMGRAWSDAPSLSCLIGAIARMQHELLVSASD